MENKYTVEQMAEARWFYSFIDVNEKGEKLIIELTKCTDTYLNNSLPELWKKNGYINRVLETYWGIQTYVKDTEGNSFGIYNPQHKLDKDRRREVINFDWMFEATEEKKRKIKEYAIKNNIELYKTVPQGWDKLNGCLTGPIGIVWISNMELFKSGNRKKAILLAD